MYFYIYNIVRPYRFWGPTQPPIQWVKEAFSLGVKRPRCEADHSPPSSAEVKKCVELYLHSPIHLHGAVLKLSAGTTLPYFYFYIKYSAHLRGPFAKFVDLPYYSESELCGGSVTVSFSKYLHWQEMHFLQRSTHFSKTCCRPFATSFMRIVEQAVLTSELPFHCWKSPEIAWGEIRTVWRMFWWGSTDLGERIHCHFSIAQR
jgi:hypothetical protein